MSRLTEKREDGSYYDLDECMVSDCSNKLGQLEDIEEKYGIDLITLFKASKQRYIFVKNAFGEINSREIYNIDIYTKIIVYYLEYQPERQLMHQSLNMYGKTWALTRKELEK